MATRKSKGTGFVAVDEIEFRRFDFECTFQPSKAKPTTTTVPPTTTKAPTTSPAPTTIPTTTVEPTEPFECKYCIHITYQVTTIYYYICCSVVCITFNVNFIFMKSYNQMRLRSGLL